MICSKCQYFLENTHDFKERKKIDITYNRELHRDRITGNFYSCQRPLIFLLLVNLVKALQLITPSLRNDHFIKNWLIDAFDIHI